MKRVLIYKFLSRKLIIVYLLIVSMFFLQITIAYAKFIPRNECCVKNDGLYISPRGLNNYRFAFNYEKAKCKTLNNCSECDSIVKLGYDLYLQLNIDKAKGSTKGWLINDEMKTVKIDSLFPINTLDINNNIGYDVMLQQIIAKSWLTEYSNMNNNSNK